VSTVGVEQVSDSGSQQIALDLGLGSISMALGESVQVEGTPTLTDGSPVTGLYAMEWESSAPAVATVNDGLIAAVAAGTTEIVATATVFASGLSATDSIQVTVGPDPADPDPEPSDPGTDPTVDPPADSPVSIARLVLVDADTELDLMVMTDGMTIDFSALGTRNLNVRAETNPYPAGSVTFLFDGALVRTESNVPYAFAGDAAGSGGGSDYLSWTPAAGAHTLTVRPFSGAAGTGELGTEAVVELTVLDAPALPAPCPDGTIDVHGDGSVCQAPAPPPVSDSEIGFATDFEGTSVSGEHLLGAGVEESSFIDGLFFNNITSNRAYAFQEVRQDPYGAGGACLYAQSIDDDPSGGATSRAQMTVIFADPYAGVFHSSHRMYLSPDLLELQQYPSSISWFTLFEIWNEHNDSWSGDVAGSARWSFSINKATGAGQPLYWNLTGEYEQPSALYEVDLWGDGGRWDGGKDNFAVPVADYVGRWVTLEMVVKRGEGAEGRMTITITRDGEAPVTLFDVNDTTVYPGHPELGLGGYTPFKLYTSDTLLDWMRGRGKKIAAYYDDFTLFRD
jgi:hypothetical protein